VNGCAGAAGRPLPEPAKPKTPPPAGRIRSVMALQAIDVAAQGIKYKISFNLYVFAILIDEYMIVLSSVTSRNDLLTVIFFVL
jgi:hypothetical protein